MASMSLCNTGVAKVAAGATKNARPGARALDVDIVAAHQRE
jgi:7,8-dihydro-6-hydroxymethylpterin-pyrophosphokinase